MKELEFTIYWLDGKREVLTGVTISDAVRGGGYGGGAVKAIDLYVDGNDNSYIWDIELHKWVRRLPISFDETSKNSHVCSLCGTPWEDNIAMLTCPCQEDEGY